MANNKRTLTEKTHLCLHCGNETLMSLAGDFSRNTSCDETGFFSYFRHQLLICPVCHKPTLLEIYHDELMHYGTGNPFTEETILYPLNKIENTLMPKIVQDAFASALKVRNVDAGACAIMLRRTLEIILKDQGATKNNLAEKIEEIAERGLLPESLKEASSFARRFGNSAAHGNELVPDKNDINSLIEFIQYIIDYLYIIPAKIERFQAKMNRISQETPQLPPS